MKTEKTHIDRRRVSDGGFIAHSGSESTPTHTRHGFAAQKNAGDAGANHVRYRCHCN